MYELSRSLPDPDVLLALEPEELGAKMLFVLQKRVFQRDMFMPANLNAELWPSQTLPGQQTQYAAHRRDAIEVALAEAWAWLEAQGLIVPAPASNGAHGWKILSRRAKRFQNE